ncbi:hypothetical protein [Persicobacter psychrovividus]|uniref:Uncharacterized protein n=1 Tax=Persicobacter psychrovividus TaxID=387638 RepID=A0ABM7VC42_9BACT|nr:hypothetical protein PEPS_07780 [Persicobacter psychrovividus]
MKGLLQFACSIFLTGIASLYFPFWVIVPATATVAFIFNSKNSFLYGFFSILLLWVAFAAWLDYDNQQMLSAKIAELLQIPASMKLFLVLITGVFGGVLGGFGAATGGSLRKIFVQR